MKNFGKPWVIALIAVVVIGGICLFSGIGGIRSLLGGAGNLLGGGGAQEGELGQMYSAVQIDQNGCPVDATNQFYTNETIFVGLEQSQIPQGTDMFVRLSHEGQPVEDAPPIQADRDIQSCVWFEFQPGGVAGFEPGDYEAELVVNGSRVDTIAFEVVEGTASSGAFPGTGAGGAQLGALHTTSAVDDNGCAMDDTVDFYANEPVYIAMDETYIPSGTELFARLVYQGQPVEDTDPIVADQDMDTCVWFVFEGDSVSGLEPGSYEAEVYVNGSLADRTDFIIR